MPLKVDYEVIKISPIENNTIDYNTIIFKVHLTDVIDLQNSRELNFQLQTIVKGGALKLLLDMKRLIAVDSSCIGILINTAKLLRSKKGDMVLANVSPEIKSIFKTINLQNFIKIFNSEIEAENHFRYIE